MRRILAIAVALTMTVAVGSASAHHNGGGDWKGHHHWHHHHHHVIAGTNASFNGTKNDDGTYTGDLTLTLKKHSHFARMSHHNTGDTNDTGTDQTVTKTFHLDGSMVKFADSVTDSTGDGTVDFSDVQPTDVVVLKVFGGHKFRGHGARAHKSCHNGDGSNSSDSTTSTPTIKKAFVFRPQQTAADPNSKD